jgi:hypothetical protein
LQQNATGGRCWPQVPMKLVGIVRHCRLRSAISSVIICILLHM